MRSLYENHVSYAAKSLSWNGTWVEIKVNGLFWMSHINQSINPICSQMSQINQSINQSIDPICFQMSHINQSINPICFRVSDIINQSINPSIEQLFDDETGKLQLLVLACSNGFWPPPRESSKKVYIYLQNHSDWNKNWKMRPVNDRIWDHFHQRIKNTLQWSFVPPPPHNQSYMIVPLLQDTRNQQPEPCRRKNNSHIHHLACGDSGWWACRWAEWACWPQPMSICHRRTLVRSRLVFPLLHCLGGSRCRCCGSTRVQRAAETRMRLSATHPVTDGSPWCFRRSCDLTRCVATRNWWCFATTPTTSGSPIRRPAESTVATWLTAWCPGSRSPSSALPLLCRLKEKTNTKIPVSKKKPNILT